MSSHLCIRKKIEYELPEELWSIVKEYAGIFDGTRDFGIKIDFKKISKLRINRKTGKKLHKKSWKRKIKIFYQSLSNIK